MMTNQQVISRLNKIIENEQKIIQAIQRKRSWRMSERAATIADRMENITALRRAIDYYRSVN